MGGQDSDIRLRRASAADGDAIRAIVENNPDGGEVSFAPQFEANPYEINTAAHPDSVAFIAETATGEPAGTASAFFVNARLGGRIRNVTMLNNLAVAADYRNRGVAKRLVQRRINHAETQFGDDCAVVASVQNGNAPSKAVAESWADEFTYNRSMLGLEPTPDAEESGEYEIRDATVEEFAAFTEHANAFYADAELFSPYTTDGIEDSLSRTPVDEPIRRYMVALDGNEIVAGAEIQDQYKALWISVTGDGELPPAIPEGGEIRPKSIVNPWCTDGNEDAVRALIEFIRANPDGANRISVQSSPNDPFVSLFTDKLGARTVMEYTTPIRGVDELKPDRPVASPY